MWSQKRFNPRLFRNYRNNKNKTFGCCFFFHCCSGRTSRIPSGALWVTCPCYSAYILVSEEKPQHLHQRKSPHISLKCTERGKEMGRGGNGRDAFICRLPLKWTVSITAEEHMLCIRLSFEYKSSWKEACKLGPSGRLVTVNWMYPGSKPVLHK